jgi:hypothetical protein
MPKPRSLGAPSQVDKFRDLARQLECDEDEEAFKAKVVKVARSRRGTPSGGDRKSDR